MFEREKYMETRKIQSRILRATCSVRQSGQYRPHREGDIEQNSGGKTAGPTDILGKNVPERRNN